MAGRRVLSALIFFPRGGSAHVARSLARHLPAHGWDVTVLSGSRADGHGDAARFYAGLDVRTVGFDAALRAPDPMDPPPGFAAGAPVAPMHPSFEDRPDAPDRVAAALDDAAFERQVATWARALRAAGARDAAALHLHHLTPIHEAAGRVAPDVPVVGHLHGTELLMLEQIADGAPASWTHARAWEERMRRWAQRCQRLILLSAGQVERAERLLGIDPGRCVVIANGFDPSAFARRDVDRAAHWRRHLVDAPQGWRPGEEAGSVRYSGEQVESLAGATAILSVGRFTAVKRTDLLVRAFAAAREGFARPAALVLLGGHPGEWEGEHPAVTIDRLGLSDAFLAGWHDHDELPAFLSAADVLALASVREQFGQVLVEGMACGVPPIAVDRFGPGEIVRDGETGWLVEPDDEASLAAALVAAVNDPAERERRAQAALADARARYSWPALAGRLAAVLDEVAVSAAAPAPR